MIIMVGRIPLLYITDDLNSPPCTLSPTLTPPHCFDPLSSASSP
ncbi:hypothetical protein RSAG8_10198, partial [Rhizoctonia solani AG-8 WAC10335]